MLENKPFEVWGGKQLRDLTYVDDVTEAFLNGAKGALDACRLHGIRIAYLKERSPSCGVCRTHVGGALVDGPGVTAALLAREGIEVRPVEGRRE